MVNDRSRRARSPLAVLLGLVLTGCGGAEVMIAADVISAAVKASVEYAEANRPTPDEAFQQARVELLREKGRRGDRDAQYALAAYFQSIGDTEARLWMCEAANAGHTRAQVHYGHWFNEDRLREDLWPFIRVTPDDREAFVWYSLAAAKSDLQATLYLGQLDGAGFDGDRLTQARRRLASWQPSSCSGSLSADAAPRILPR